MNEFLKVAVKTVQLSERKPARDMTVFHNVTRF